MKHKLSVVGVLLFGVILIVCSHNNITAKNDKSIVEFPVQSYNGTYSSIPGQPIKLTLDDAVFECTTDTGSFSYNELISHQSIASGETVFWCPSYNENGKASATLNRVTVNNGYVDIIIKKDAHIIGYIVIYVSGDENNFAYYPEVLASVIFPKKMGMYQDVTEEYVLGQIKNEKSLQ
ncbi:MAG: hypothetical protein E7261_06075 [Lachnospiraceae bacterium]|nr:hypothetical protein [Lachnospiraceae bacterium]